MRCIVTQMPVGGFGSLTSTFGNHLATMDSAPRGGDVVIRYPDGSLRFPTQEARTPFRRALHWGAGAAGGGAHRSHDALRHRGRMRRRALGWIERRPAALPGQRAAAELLVTTR